MVEALKNFYLLYGPPGSGKTSLAEKLSSTFDLEYISVGNLSRGEILKGTPRGIELKRCLDTVIEYPVELISGLVEEKIKECVLNNQKFIIDGFPKYPQEARAFRSIIKEQKLRIDSIIVVDLSLEEAIKRVSNRRFCPSCLIQVTIESNGSKNCPRCEGILTVRDDDEPYILKRRYNDYQESVNQTLGILGEGCNKIVHVDGTKPFEEIVRFVVDGLTAK